MSDVVIRVENLSKRYRLGGIGARSLADDVSRMWARMKGAEDPLLKIGAKNDRLQLASKGHVWVLDKLSFDIHRGEVVGIIGKNGAGKSTLLKILSRVTGPTAGEVKIKGRIASLLEVGTGFHPELTGRENVFLNGAIMGMSKNEIRKKFDEILDFSGIGGYIDTPVKRYSSGMYVRLAFAVAAYLEPEILIIDEVLAVGDAEFQKKALGKMESVSKNEGRTVLFVSHSMSAVQALCSRCIMLEQGKVALDGLPRPVVDHYLNGGLGESVFGTVGADYPRNQYHPGMLRIRAVDLLGSDGNRIETLRYHERMRVRITLDVEKPLNDVIVALTAGNELEENILFASSADRRNDPPLVLQTGEQVIEMEINQQLQPGSYFTGIMLWDKNGYPYDALRRFGRFFVEDFGDNDRYYRWKSRIGMVNPDTTVKLLT